jgi:hypothetical protein
MIINNWELWQKCREDKNSLQVVRHLEKCDVVKRGTIKSKDLLAQLRQSGLEVKPALAVETTFPLPPKTKQMNWVLVVVVSLVIDIVLHLLVLLKID